MYQTLHDRKTLNQTYQNLTLDNRIFYGLQFDPHGSLLPWVCAVDNTTLDNIYFMIHSGNKIVSKITEYYANLAGGYMDTTQNQILCHIVFEFFIKKWTELYNTMFYQYEPISNYDMVETETTTGSTNDAVTGSRTETPYGSETTTTDYTGTEKDKLTKNGEEKLEREYTGTEKDKLTKNGEEKVEREYAGIENTSTTYEGQESNETEYGGREDNTFLGSKTNERTFEPVGEESEIKNGTETYNGITDTATEWGFNSDLEFAPTPQNTNVKTGSQSNSESLTRSFIGRLDTTTETLSFNDYIERKEFDNRVDTATKSFNGREDNIEKSFTDRKDTDKTTFTDRYDENEKTFTNRKDTDKTTFANRFDENEKTFTNRQDKSTLSFSEDRQTQLNTSDTLTRSSIVTRTLTRKGNIGVTTSQQMIQAQRELLLWDYFYNVVFPDLDNFLTLQIYK